MIRAQVLEFRIIVALQSLRYRAAVRFGIECILLAVPGIDEGTGLLRQNDNGRDSNDRSHCQSRHQPNRSGTRCFNARHPQSINLRQIDRIVGAANAR